MGKKMNRFIELLNVQVILFIYILVGIYTKKKEIITKENQQKFIDLLLQVLMPCMIFNSFKQQLTPDVIKRAWIIISIAFGVAFVALILGKICYRKYPYEKRTIMQYGT